MELVERIQELCDKNNTTLIGIERELELSRGTIRRWNTNTPSADKLLKVAEYFNVTVEYLLNGKIFATEEPQPQEEKEAFIDKFLKTLIDTGIISDPNNIDDNVKEMILNAVKIEIERIKKDEN